MAQGSTVIYEVNRQARIDATRLLGDLLKRATERGGFWGSISVKLILEDSKVKLVAQTQEETHPVSR